MPRRVPGSFHDGKPVIAGLDNIAFPDYAEIMLTVLAVFLAGMFKKGGAELTQRKAV